MAARLQVVLEALEQIIHSRRDADDSESYSARLLHGSIDHLLKKIGEEATEVVIAGKGGEREEILYESADLLYHLLVLWTREGITLADISIELSRRFGISGLAEKANRNNR